MAALPSLRKLLPSVDKLGNPLRSAWDRLSRLPGGKRLFSRLVGMMAPYTGSIGAQVVELSRGHAKVEMRDRPGVRNHLKSLHAVALVNLAELTGNVAVQYALPDDARFIVAGLSIDYLKKSRGTITATADIDIGSGNTRREVPVEVILRDKEGDVVARSTLRTLIGPKKGS